MTKKDYEAFARALREAAEDEVDLILKPYLRRTFASIVANVLARDNPRFDRERFYKACGLEE